MRPPPIPGRIPPSRGPGGGGSRQPPPGSRAQRWARVSVGAALASASGLGLSFLVPPGFDLAAELLFLLALAVYVLAMWRLANAVSADEGFGPAEKRRIGARLAWLGPVGAAWLLRGSRRRAGGG